MTRRAQDLPVAGTAPFPPVDETGRLDAPDPFDPASLRLDPGAELVAVKKVIVRVPVRKPGPQEFVRVHPDPGRRLDTALIELKEERETYLLAPGLRAELGDEAKPTRLYTAISRAGALFLWPVALPGPDGRRNPWHESAHRGPNWRSASGCGCGRRTRPASTRSPPPRRRCPTPSGPTCRSASCSGSPSARPISTAPTTRSCGACGGSRETLGRWACGRSGPRLVVPSTPRSAGAGRPRSRR